MHSYVHICSEAQHNCNLGMWVISTCLCQNRRDSVGLNECVVMIFFALTTCQYIAGQVTHLCNPSGSAKAFHMHHFISYLQWTLSQAYQCRDLLISRLQKRKLGLRLGKLLETLQLKDRDTRCKIYNYWEHPIQHRELYLTHHGDLNGKGIWKGGEIYVYIWLAHFAMQ